MVGTLIPSVAHILCPHCNRYLQATTTETPAEEVVVTPTGERVVISRTAEELVARTVFDPVTTQAHANQHYGADACSAASPNPTSDILKVV